MASFKDIENKTLDTSYDAGVAMSERFRKAQESVDWNDHPYLNMTDAGKASYSPVNRTYGAEQLLEVKSDAGTIAYDTFRKGVLDLASLPEKAQMTLGNTLAGITGDRLGTEMRDKAYDSLMKTMEDSRFIDSNYGDAESWTARWTGGAMSMGETLTIGALTGPVGLGAFVGTLSLSDGALNDMANYYQEHGNLDGYETDPVNLALDYGNAVFQVASEMIGGTGRLLNGRVLKAGSTMGAVVKETVSNFMQESLQGLAADATEVLKGNEDVNILLENAGGYVKDGIVGGVLGGVTGGTFYRVNKGRGKGSIKEVLRKLYPQKNEKELDDGAETIWAKTEEKGLKTFVPEIVAHTEAVNDKGKIRENIKQKVSLMFEDADMSEKERARAIEATTTVELENMLYDSIERKVPLTSHPLLQGEMNDLGWFRAGIPAHRRTEIDALNAELVELKTQQKELMSAQKKDYAKLEEIEAKLEQFRKNLPEKLGDLVVADREQVNQMLKAQRNRVAQSMQKKQVLQKIKEKAKKSAEKQDKADAKLAEQMATGAEKAKAQRVKAETAQQTKEAKARTLTEQREIASSIKGLRSAISERKRMLNLELKYAIGQATDESLRNVLKNRKLNAYTVDNMTRRQLIAAVKEIPNLSIVELVPMSKRDISYQQEMAEAKQEKTKTAKGFFHRKINRDFANESGILQAWGYSKGDPAINLVFVKDGGFKDWDAIVMELQDNGYLPQTYARTYEETDALVEQAKDIVLNNKELTTDFSDVSQQEIDYVADRGEVLLQEAGYTPEQIQAMSLQEMSDKLAELYKTETEQLTKEQAAQIPDDLQYQDEVFKIAEENARLDAENKPYDKETIVVNGVERTVYNSNGERIAKSEPALRNFWNWFGDSKVVDDKGRPLVVYHGTNAEFDTFRENKIGVFFSSVSEQAIEYGKRVVSAYLKIENPFTVPKTQFELNGIKLYPNNYDTIAIQAQKSGYDGVINKDVIDSPLPQMRGFLADNYTAFEPNQIKSTENRGTFSKDTGNIYFQFAGEKAETAALDKLAQAKQLDANGVNNEEIRQKTGWFKGADGKWRFEISDEDAELDLDNFRNVIIRRAKEAIETMKGRNDYYAKEVIRQPAKKELSAAKNKDLDLFDLMKEAYGEGVVGFKLGDLLKHDKLYEAYPFLREFGLNFIFDKNKGLGARATNSYISINYNADKNAFADVASTILHEIQHVIQSEELFSVGGTPETAKTQLNLNTTDRYFRDSVKEKLNEDELDSLFNFDNLWKLLTDLEPQNTSKYKTELEKYLTDYDFTEDKIQLVLDVVDSQIQKNQKVRALQKTTGELSDFETYQRIYGEVEARNVQARARMTEAERTSVPVEQTQDIKNAESFVVFGGGVSLSYVPIQKQTKATGKGKDVRGAFVPEYRFIAKTGNLDASTLAHELAHDWGQENFRWARSGKASEEFMRAWGAVEKAIGITDKDIYFTYDASEKFARAYEGWLLERKDWADVLHVDTDEEKKAVAEVMEDYRKDLVEIYESLTNPYFTMAWGKTGELKPELKAWFERSTKFDELDSQVARGEITEEQAGEEKLKEMLETAVNSVDNLSPQDQQAVDVIDKLEQLKRQESQFEVEGGNRNRLQRRLDAISLAQNMIANNQALGKYNTHRDMLAVAEAADIFVNTRLNDALAIINGKMPEQDGLYASDLYTALERKAKKDNDFGLVEELRNSLIANQLAKELGQRVAGFRNYTASGDVDIMSTLKSLDKLYDKAYNEKEREQLEEDVKAYFESVAVADSQLDLDGFFNELECK